MADLAFLTSPASPGAVAATSLPALGYLGHRVSLLPLDAASVAPALDFDLVLVDATQDLARAQSLCTAIRVASQDVPLVVVIAEAALAGLQRSWGTDDFLLPTAGPAEIEARFRLISPRDTTPSGDGTVRVGDLEVDPVSYQVRVRGRPLDLTFKEFELLRFLAARPGRVLTRSQLLSEVWGYDFFGGTRTVDVHVRRLRAKLGPERESMIATVRGVGYKLIPAEQARAEREGADHERGGGDHERGGGAPTGPGAR